ncbi:PREDICTED: cap-specific mRNA (nucleoside-2'-O-)-methyltransferase 2 isoform X2 [Wasmannia auropunctata]|uniref:cap-specific mRNA (nucleoside-2'-O-)-methyltransferase 2 isoform X2 n=1 Tax=Wasmannia auropunctata TaxID=64793 RepID=UPI0005EFA717|nr:PREDICTED: cap-specific mRNA (nucleoside-2'-O-)-methyltransferase 2 isoform X2 [Wasmannia auropunctata]
MENEENNSSRKQPKRSQDEYNDNTDLSTRVSVLFERHFTISDVQRDTQTYALPDVGSMFAEPPWQLDQLQTTKRDLNAVKSRLNNFNLGKWQQHTNRMNEAGDIVRAVREDVQAELATQAWCKFYEIASKFSLVPLNEIHRGGMNGRSFKSVHLCEAPGAFVAALNHWLQTNAPDVRWSWLATTLNPYCEGNSYDSMIADDRFIRHTLRHWCFGADNTGDVMNLRNLDALVERSAESLDGGGPILLVTADGSIDCTDVPGEQESVVAQLHLCETVACMHLLQRGGNFLLKLFTLFEHRSVCLMYLLSCAFHQVIATKPASSKGGNSEMYVVCVNFKGRDHVAPYLPVLRHYYGDVPPASAMFSLRDIPDGFLQRIEQCGKFFKFHQCRVIKDNIRTFCARENFHKDLHSVAAFKRTISAKYLENCRLSKIDAANEIVGREVIERTNKLFMNKRLHIDSYNERSEITRDLAQQIDPSHEILSFQFVQDHDGHRTIAEIYERLEKLESGRTLVFIGYSLLTQLNIGLLYLLGKSFNKITVEVNDEEGYRLKLETYRRNERVLNYLHEILVVSHNAREDNMAVWSIIPMTVLYEYEQIPVMMQLNHLMIKLYARHVINTIGDPRHLRDALVP